MASRRKVKKGTLHYALEVCDSGQLTAIISSKGDVDGKAGAEVMKWIRRSKETFRDDLSPLQGAVTLGHYNICKHLVEEGAMLNSASTIPHPLCIALEKAHYEIAHLLLKAGADVNLAFEDSLPLSFALDDQNCTVQIVKEIIAAGFPKNGIVHRSSQRTALHSAVRMNHLSIVKYLLSLSVDINVRDKIGLTPLHYAVLKDYPAMVKLLAKNGANLDCECEEYFTPMFNAIARGSLEMAQLLISLGADINYVNGSKRCSMMPLHFAANTCQFKIVKLLLEKGADVNKVVPMTGEIALHAAARGSTQKIQQNKIALDCIVELLIKYGSNLTVRHKYGLTPLQVAIKARNVSLAKILVTNGSEINNKLQENNDKLYTTFHIVARSFDAELIKLCFDCGADCNARSEKGIYPCHMALLTAMFNASFNGCQTESEQWQVLKLFWKHGFPYDLTLKMKWLGKDTPPAPTKIATLMQKQKLLFIGLKTQQLKIVQQAINDGAEVKCCSTDIPFPLHYMASRKNESIMKLFLSRGVSVNCLDKRGQTPLHVAAKAGNVNSCRLLLEYGAFYNYKSPKCSKTPLKLATDKGHSEVVTLLTTVDKYFKSLRKGRLEKLKPNKKTFYALMNCSNRDGMSLLEKALELGMRGAAERIMKLRLTT